MNAIMLSVRCFIKVAKRIAEILDRRERMQAEVAKREAENKSLTRQWVLDRLQENVERAMQRIPVTDKDGHTVEYRYDGAVANRALELLGKEIGLFIERRETGRPGDFAGLSDQELEEKLMATLIERGLSEEAARLLVAKQQRPGGMRNGEKADA